jgi:hypothetical protein
MSDYQSYKADIDKQSTSYLKGEIERLTALNVELEAAVQAVKRIDAEGWADDAGGYDPAWFDVLDALAQIDKSYYKMKEKDDG